MKPQDLRRISVLQSLEDDSLGRLAPLLEERRFQKEQPIFREGDPGDSVYFLVEGMVRIEKRSNEEGTAHKTLAVLAPGDYFGEVSLFDRQPRSASAVAVGDTLLFRLAGAAFDGLLKTGGAAGMAVLSGMIRTAGERIRRLSSQIVAYDEIGKAIGESATLDQLLATVIHQLNLATLADWGILLLKPEFAERLQVRVVEGLELSAEQETGIAEGRGFLTRLLQTPAEHLIEKTDAAELFQSVDRLGFEPVALLIAPIMLGDKLLGLILLGGEEAGAFDLDALNLARGVARQTAQAVLNARHREEEQARSRHSRQYVQF